MKKLLGTAVKKTTGAAKLVADVAKKGRLKESNHPSGATSIVGKDNDKGIFWTLDLCSQFEIRHSSISIPLPIS